MHTLGLSVENEPERSESSGVFFNHLIVFLFFRYRIYAVKTDRKAQNKEELTVRRGELI
jgi:hypothetical protein